jgi:hypothetical protein
MRVGLDAAEVSVRAAETTVGAAAVIAARVRVAAAAAQDPLAGDYAEIGRIIPEKMRAVSEAGAALFDEWWALQRETADYLLYVGCTVTRSRVLLPGDVIELVERSSSSSSRIAGSGIGAAGAALAPVHRTVTANVRRLFGESRRT